MNKQIKFWVLSVVIVLIAIAISIGIVFWFYKNNFLKAPVQPIVIEKDTAKNFCTQEAKQCPDGSYVSRHLPNCEFAACPASNTNETSDWQTYRNEKYGFEFQYPSNLSVKEGESSVELLTKEELNWEKEHGYPGGPPHLTIYINNQGPSGFDSDHLRKQIIFAGENATEMDGDSDAGYGSYYEIDAKRGDYYFSLYFQGVKKKTLTEGDRQIITTFKFID